MLSRMLVIGLLFTALDAPAQVPPPEFDASIPDASVGGGSAEQSQEMDEGRANTVCAQSRDCERGLVGCSRPGSAPAQQGAWAGAAQRSGPEQRTRTATPRLRAEPKC